MMSIQGSPVENAVFSHLAEQIRGDRALQKLNELAKDITGLFLVVLVRIDDQLVELYPAGGETELPPFCQVYRSASQGMRRCLTCRSLVAFGACYRGLIEYACHGGVSVIAAPAMRRDGMVSRRVVVASCSFAHSSHATGWPLVKTHAQGLGARLKELRRAYSELPVVTEQLRHVARGITEVAASMVGEIEEKLERENRSDEHAASDGKQRGNTDLQGLWSPLGLARDRSFKQEGKPAGSVLVDLVVAMVKRDPSMPYSVTNIARAARVTPNHFSMLFSKHTEQTFQAFLTEQRIRRACDLLRNLSLDIAEVAHRSGFPDPAYFSRRFKRATGSTPTDWRTNLPRSEVDRTPSCVSRDSADDVQKR